MLKVLFVAMMLVFSYFLSLHLAKSNQFAFLPSRKGRYGTIDGLRGYLALAVFVHHFIITWYWQNSGAWVNPPEDYFYNFGEVGVMLFFMITGFLFISKIIAGNGRMDWYRLYKSRIFRIYPLYLFSLLIITIIIFIETDLQIQVEWSTLVKQYVKWFAYHGTMINDHTQSQLINAGVDWTLKYEWLFYLSLPLIALMVTKSRYALMALFVLSGLLFIFPTYLSSFSTRYFFFFAIGGMVAHFYTACSKRTTLLAFVDSRYGSVVTVAVLIFALFYSGTGSIIHVVSVSLFFLLIVLGSSVFGLFRSKASVLLGEISYSIYLLHGIILYALFSSGDIIDLTEISLLEYLYILPVVALLVILFSASTYLEIEKPGVAMGKRVGFDWVKGWLGGRFSGVAGA